MIASQKGSSGVAKSICGWAICLALAACSGNGSSDAVPTRTEAVGVVAAGFGNQGSITFPRAGVFAGLVTDIAQLGDGSYLVGGGGPYVARLSSDGRLDPSFASGGIDLTQRGTRFEQNVARVVLLADGRVLVAEIHRDTCVRGPTFCTLPVTTDVVVRRIDSRGEVDSTYGEQGRATLHLVAGDVLVSPRGRVTSFYTLVQSNHFGVASLDASGARDSSYDARAFDAVRSCATAYDFPGVGMNLDFKAVSSGEKIVVATHWQTTGPYIFCVSRLNADGSLDSSFGNAGHQIFAGLPGSHYVFRVLLRDDGGIVVAVGGTPPGFLFLTPSGAKDTAVVDGGAQTAAVVPARDMRDVTLQANGKTVAIGLGEGNSARISRSSPSGGTYDAGFGPAGGGYATLPEAGGPVLLQKVFVDRDGAILVGGHSAATLDGILFKLQ